MRPGIEAPRSIGENLKDLDETELAIERLERRIGAQEARIAQLKRDGIDCSTAQEIRANMHQSLGALLKHRSLVQHALAYRKRRSA
ncbi:hypothetical protein [Cupriavidus consociatus]|uniref:hypothetical protein n=1 Tax=Cupriavidus consociatus TaxID=2821357 RepID=UPI001AE24398|nr:MULTISPECIES: hypothetical protein [unclassified Cupriavidus]MBP0624723.1 hypothetical protein [Cupriavidus sp. LEh25]MDK2661435.1 hypothetical protein [Cupriavidus sp. LEh21]